MATASMVDWQFGALEWQENWGWCASGVEWDSDLAVNLCLVTELTERGEIPESVRDVFRSIKDREKELKKSAIFNFIDVDGYNKYYDELYEAEKPDGWPFDIDTICDMFVLSFVMIDPCGDSELQYITGGPLFRVFVSPDITISEAFSD